MKNDWRQNFFSAAKVEKNLFLPNLFLRPIFRCPSIKLPKSKKTVFIMATNPPKGDGHRNGAVRNRTQVLNPTTKVWTKRGSDGKFMDGKADGTPFKGVTKEK